MICFKCKKIIPNDEDALILCSKCRENLCCSITLTERNSDFRWSYIYELR